MALFVVLGRQSGNNVSTPTVPSLPLSSLEHLVVSLYSLCAVLAISFGFGVCLVPNENITTENTMQNRW